jgi:cephalosporin-C deacetylase-like acetyl esterase
MKMNPLKRLLSIAMGSLLSITTILLFPAIVFAQPTRQPVQIMVAPDHTNWQYQPGEKAKFSVRVLQNNVPLNGATVTYAVAEERMKPAVSGTKQLADGSMMLEGSMAKPGFLRCTVTAEVGGKKYTQLATVGYKPLDLRPTIQKPADFDSFWTRTKNELKQLPIDARLRPLPERSSALTEVFEINMQGYGGSRLYGILCVPRKEGRYPAILKVPGAGIRPYGPDLTLADQGFIVLIIGIHGIPVTIDPGVYNDLVVGGLRSYFFYSLDDKDRYYYKRVYANCVRANDYLVQHPKFDGVNLAVTGGSQGGALSIVAAALDSRVKYLAALYPALCDVTGYLNGRAGGWPHMFNETNGRTMATPAAIATMGYYDVANFAPMVKATGWYSWGFNDETCPPTSMYAAYNVITAPKSLTLYEDTGHWTYPEQNEALNNWLMKMLRQ